MKKIALTIAMLLTVATSWARPGYTKPVDVFQPDGTTVTLLMRGDEFMSFMTTIDGYTVIKGEDGYYRYADKQGDSLVATAVVARNPEQRKAEDLQFLNTRKKNIQPEISASALKRKADASQLYAGNYTTTVNGPRRAANIWSRINYEKFKGLVVLVEWSDRKFTMDDPQAFYQRMTSEKNLVDTSHKYYSKDVKGSTRDYFFDNSMGIFDPTFDVVGPVQINYSCTYPSPKTATGADDPGFDDRLVNILRSTMTKVNQLVDFNDYDLNNDGKIDMVYFIFAGYGSYVQGNSYKYTWPHANDFSYYSRMLGMRYDNKYFGRYACSVEIQDYEAMANQHVWLDGIGTMCHEFSHVLGLADHYDTDYELNGTADTPSKWDLMADGADHDNGLSPVGYSAFERHILGFTEPQVIDVAGTYQLEPFNTKNQCYIINTGTLNDDYYIENRQNEGWDTSLPGHGLLAWRVETTNSSVWRSNNVNINPEHTYLELVKAVPNRSIDTGYTPFPGQGKVVDLTATTTPALLSWAGKEAVVDLYDITETADGIITFNAGKNIYESMVEDFETMEPTTADATDLAGKASNWSLKNATIAAVDGEQGNGTRVVKIQRSGTLTSAAFTKNIRSLSLKAWTGNQQVKVTLRGSSDGGTTWQTIKTPDGATSVTLSKNSSATPLQFNTELPAGSQIQIMVTATSNSAVAYMDDITISFGKEQSVDGIDAMTVNRQNSTSSLFNLAGQRVGSDYKGLVVKDGKKRFAK